ncbi:MAG: hypothetical protein ACI80V_001609 [Rhodothermales bacterium]
MTRKAQAALSIRGVAQVIHPHTELRFISREVGHGVVATQHIPKGTVTWILDRLDRVFLPQEVEDLGPDYQDLIDTYAFRNNIGEYVLCWDNARYVNHSFRSNCLTTAYDFELAIRDIEAGEQLTDDYGYLNVSHPFVPLDEGTRRTTVYADDVLRYRRSWDKSLRSAFDRFPSVAQPLQSLMSDEVVKRCHRIAAGEEEMASIAANYYRDGLSNARKKTATLDDHDKQGHEQDHSELDESDVLAVRRTERVGLHAVNFWKGAP